MGTGDRQAFAINKIYWPRDVELFYRCDGQENNVAPIAASPTPTFGLNALEEPNRTAHQRYGEMRRYDIITDQTVERD